MLPLKTIYPNSITKFTGKNPDRIAVVMWEDYGVTSASEIDNGTVVVEVRDEHGVANPF